MLQADPLDFLDDSVPEERKPIGAPANAFLGRSNADDPLSFLDARQKPVQQATESASAQPSFFSKVANFFGGSKPEDPLAFLEPKPQKSIQQSTLDIYRVKEKTPEEYKAMSVSERVQYNEDIKRERELRQAFGLAKGAASGLTFGASEHIPALKPNEEDLMVGLGETLGSYLPIAKLYNFIGKPLVTFAAKSPVARQGLEALARMTGFGLTGATYKGTKELVKGEVPDAAELAKEGAMWFAIDAALQGAGLGIAFQQSVARIAEAEGVTAKEILGRLWNATKNYTKLKFGRPIKGEVLPEDAEVLFEQAKKAEAEIKPKEPEVQVEPIKEQVAPPKEPTRLEKTVTIETSPEITPIAKPETTEPVAATAPVKIYDLDKPIDSKLTNFLESLDYPNLGKNVTLTKIFDLIADSPQPDEVKREDFEDIKGFLKENGYEGVKYIEDKDKNPREMVAYFEPEKQSEADIAQAKNAPIEFTTSKGSTYQVNPDGGTTRIKAARTEHPGEQGLQPASEKTWYVTPEDALKLGEFQTSGNEKSIVELPNGKLGVQYLTGKDAGKVEQRTLVDFSKEPTEGMIPVESWDNGKKVHFGNQIIEVEHPTLPSKTEPPKKQTQVPPRQTRPKQPVFGKKQAVARSKILDLFRTAFTDPIRLGKISQRNAAGIHKLWPKVTRLLNDNDIETAAHEIGHNLHTTLYGGNAATPKEQVKNIEAALHPYLNELKPLAHYEPWGMEGFAEFTRLYVTNPETAQELAPKFYAKFEADLGAQYPEMKNALLQAREYYDTYLQGTPQSRIRAQTSYGSDNGKLANIVDSVKKYLKPDFLKTQFLDDVFPAKRLVAEAFGISLAEVENLKDERNLYRALRVLKGAVGKGDVFVLHETFNANTLKKTGEGLRHILKQLPNEEAYREFNDYLIARRAIEKTAQNIKTGINAGDAVIVEQELRPKYGELAQELDKYNDALLHYAKDAGLLSPDQYKAIKENNVLYTPFQRVIEAEKGGAATGAGKLQAGKPIKRMKGSTRNIIAPIESIIKNTYSIILNAEKNLAGQVLANLAKTKPNIGAYVEHVPTPIKLKGKVEGEQVARDLAKRFAEEGLDDLIEYDKNGKPVLREDIADAIPDAFLKFGAGQYPAGENIVTVYFEGKPKYYQVSPDIFEMWSKGIAPYTAGLITKILRMPARTLRAGAILNPRFIQKNFIRDTWGSWLFTKYGKSIKDPVGLFIDTLYSPLEMMAASAMKRQLYIDWMKAGGGMSTMQSLDRNAVTKKLEEVRHGHKPHHVIKWLRQVAEISEEANRLAEFGKALAVEQKSRLGAEIAAFAARDLSVDFAKMGLQTKALNQVIPFFNATIQGGDKLIRTMMNPEDRKDFLPRVIGFIVLPSLMLAWLNKDDDRVKEFHEEEKDFNFITFVGDKAIKIPVPFETGVLAHGLTQRMFNYFMKEDSEAFEGLMGSVAAAMLPNIIPTFANPFLEVWENKNFFTGARIIPRNQEELISRYQYKRGTSSSARLLGRAMTYMLGQETRSKAASPEIIDHFINAWTGGLGRVMINISDASLEAAGIGEKVPGPGQTITERLGLDAFSARYPRASTRSIEKFYDNYADASSRLKSLKHAEKMLLETPEGQEAAYKRFDKIYDYGTLQHAYKAIQSSQREINNIWNDPSIPDALKEKMVDGLYLQQIEFAKAANEDIRKHRLTQRD